MEDLVLNVIWNMTDQLFTFTSCFSYVTGELMPVKHLFVHVTSRRPWCRTWLIFCMACFKRSRACVEFANALLFCRIFDISEWTPYLTQYCLMRLVNDTKQQVVVVWDHSFRTCVNFSKKPTFLNSPPLLPPLISTLTCA